MARSASGPRSLGHIRHAKRSLYPVNVGPYGAEADRKIMDPMWGFERLGWSGTLWKSECCLNTVQDRTGCNRFEQAIVNVELAQDPLKLFTFSVRI